MKLKLFVVLPFPTAEVSFYTLSNIPEVLVKSSCQRPDSTLHACRMHVSLIYICQRQMVWCAHLMVLHF